MRSQSQATEASDSASVAYGQLVVLGPPRASSVPYTFQWRTAAAIVEGPVEEWLRRMGIGGAKGSSAPPADPMLAALNYLARDGWRLVAFEELESNKPTYDPGQAATPFVTARWWLIREGTPAERKEGRASSKPSSRQARAAPKRTKRK